VIKSLAVPMKSDPIARYRSDMRRRFPESAPREEKPTDHRPGRKASRSKPPHRLEKLPPEIGVLLIVVGVAGVLLPGPVGSPFLVAGGLALWPSGFQKLEYCMQKVSPRLFKEGMRQLERYLSDLERRYPGSTR
jgi:hypothetical protein